MHSQDLNLGFGKLLLTKPRLSPHELGRYAT